MPKRTKIIATIGPSSSSEKVLCSMIKHGMNVARLNFSHGDYDSFKAIVKAIRAAETKCKKNIGLLQDLQGPKFRIGDLEEPFKVKTGTHFSLAQKNGKNTLAFPKIKIVYDHIKKNDELFIDDGMIRTKILSKKKGVITVVAMTSGIITSRRGINLPSAQLPDRVLLSSTDKRDLKFGLTELKVDAVALSFVEKAEDILRTKKLITKYTKHPVMVIAKIERRKAIENLESIVQAADGIMIARGDLAIETHPEMVPIYQKRILKLSREHGKPVILATQILQSMIEAPCATRAEVSDAAQAIFDHADAVMLSNESAVGKHPIEAVETLSRIAEVTEAALFQEAELFPVLMDPNKTDPEDNSLVLNACEVAEEINAEKIIVLTKSGYTARTLLKHRPETPTIILSPNTTTQRQLLFSWGTSEIIPYKGKYDLNHVRKFLIQKRLLKKSALAVGISLSEKKRSLEIMNQAR